MNEYVRELRINNKLLELAGELLVFSGKRPYLRTAGGVPMEMGRAKEARVQRITKALRELGTNICTENG